MTTMKSMILAAALGLASMTVASAKTYNVVLTSPTQAGNLKLDAGSYKMNINGHMATFTNVETNKSVMTMVRFDTSSVSYYQHTAVEVKNENGTAHIEGIELEDTGNKIEF